MRYFRRMAGGAFDPCPGKPKSVEIPGAEWAEWFAARIEAPSPDSDAAEQKHWFIYHKRTGVMVAGGSTLAKAVKEAQFLLSQPIETGVKARLDSLPTAPTEAGLFA